MFYWGYWVGPLIAVVLALRLRPAYLVVLGLAATAGFFASYNTTVNLYGHCENQCPPNRDIMVWVNGILLTLAPALLLLALLKHVLRADSGFSAKPS